MPNCPNTVHGYAVCSISNLIYHVLNQSNPLLTCETERAPWISRGTRAARRSCYRFDGAKQARGRVHAYNVDTSHYHGTCSMGGTMEGKYYKIL